MKKIIRLTESDLTRLVKKIVNENIEDKLKVNLEINCPQRVITSTTVPLTAQGNSKVLDAYCTTVYRKNS